MNNQPCIEVEGDTYYRWWVHHRGGIKVVIWACSPGSAMRVAQRRADDGDYWTVPQRAVPAGRFF